MLRDLATVIDDLYRGMQAAADHAGPGVRIVQAETTLPVDTALVLKDGGCVLLIDVARNAADASWLQSPSRLTLSWGEVPTEPLPMSHARPPERSDSLSEREGRSAEGAPMSSAMPPMMQESGVPFDVFITSLTEQLDRAQASMALKARVAKLPLTFAVKDVSLDLRAFVQLVDDDVFVRPAGPGDTEASTIKLTLTTITRSMVEENAVDFKTEDPQFSLREAMHGQLSDEDQRRLERIGVRTVEQLTDLRKTAGADVVARLARMPVNRLQQALLAAAAPRVTEVEPVAPDGDAGGGRFGANARVHLRAPGLRAGRIPFVRAAGQDVPVIESHDGHIVLAPYATQLGLDAEIDFGDGEVAHVPLTQGSIGRWAAVSAPTPRSVA